MRTRHDSNSQAGQVLPITALFMTVLLLFAALAIDVTNLLSAERFYTATADASALAGAQDLQTGKTRQVSGQDRADARRNAMAVLVDQLNGSSTPTGGTCAPNSDVIDCALPGTPYLVSIKTPSPTCVSCDPDRSVQVTVRHPSYALTFARLVGQNDWNMQSTAVAGLVFGANYAIETLRPPDPLPNETDKNRQNISVDGTNTWLEVIRGDVGTNTSAVTNSGARITLGSGYRIDHIDDITPDPWNKEDGLPAGKLITRLIPDPAYPIADFTGAPTFATQQDGEIACPSPGTGGFPPDYKTILEDPELDITCYQPGTYQDKHGFNVSKNTDVAYLLPGAYRFEEKGLDIGGTLMGGLVGDEPGVVLVIPQVSDFAGNNSVAIMLNLGDETCTADSCRANPAIDWAGNEVKTPAGLVITVEVPRDERCFSGTTPIDEPKCTTDNNTINLPGNGQLAIAGVIYAPSDNVQVNGDNTDQVGEVGQLVAWTVKYAGGAKLTQDYPELEEIGVLRLDAACTGLEACNDP